jgi:hypothetical protein
MANQTAVDNVTISRNVHHSMGGPPVIVSIHEPVNMPIIRLNGGYFFAHNAALKTGKSLRFSPILRMIFIMVMIIATASTGSQTVGTPAYDQGIPFPPSAETP